jgi:hypothetical protein
MLIEAKTSLGNLIRLPGAYAPSTRKTYFEMLKKTKNIAFTYSQFKRVCKVLLKTDTFYGLYKKEKNCYVKCLIIAPNFILFTHAT